MHEYNRNNISFLRLLDGKCASNNMKFTHLQNTILVMIINENC